MGYGRIFFAIARDGQWPPLINRLCRRINARGVPYGALLLLGVLNAAMIALSGVTYLILFTGSLLLLIYLGIQISALVLRLRGQVAPYRMPRWPWPPLVASAAALFLLVHLGRTQLMSIAVILVIAAILAWTAPETPGPGNESN
jgi:amino acid transporter